MTNRPPLIAMDLEGILLPEIWIAVAERTGISQLRYTTRDIEDYDELMQMRLGILREHNLGIHDIQEVIATMDILPGAADFLQWLRAQSVPFIIITDSFYELVAPFQPKLGHVTIFAHSLQVDQDGMVIGYRLRVDDGKSKTLRAFRSLGFHTFAVGDSYNDIGMLKEASHASLYRPSEKVVADYPQFPIALNYADLQVTISEFLKTAS